jgi:hypothetical protein
LLPGILIAQQEYFNYARTQIKKYNPRKKNIAIVIDYKKNIFTNRLFVLDLDNNIILISSRVSHAWNSGYLYPCNFSNKIGSRKTSKGNYITESKIISPKYGYAMLIKGLDVGLNDNARNREIIFHSYTRMKSIWSYGCFATPEKKNKEIIDISKNGVLVCIISK